MPQLKREDGVELHWEERGEGPLVLLAPYWSGHPGAHEPIRRELAKDHRVLHYDARGTGKSTRQGPHDMETAAGDLAAVLEMAGGRAAVLALADSCPRAVRVAAERPELIRAVVAPGSAPVSLDALQGADALVASSAVINAFMEMLKTDYRGALRTLLTQTNPQMEESEVRERVIEQAEYCPAETAVARAEAWFTDDSLEAGRALGERLVILYSDNMGGDWLPAGDEMAETLGGHLPEARLVPIADGIVSRPDLAAGVIRDLESC